MLKMRDEGLAKQTFDDLTVLKNGSGVEQPWSG
jgi:hypothetical protein